MALDYSKEELENMIINSDIIPPKDKKMLIEKINRTNSLFDANVVYDVYCNVTAPEEIKLKLRLQDGLESIYSQARFFGITEPETNPKLDQIRAKWLKLTEETIKGKWSFKEFEDRLIMLRGEVEQYAEDFTKFDMLKELMVRAEAKFMGAPKSMDEMKEEISKQFNDW